jgi:tRNA (guanine9-N1)-methyltransferase
MEKSEKDKEEPKEEKNTTQNDNEINNKDNNKEEKPKLPISKNQLKKMKRQEEWKQKMEKIKAYKKEKKKEKKRLKREEREKEELLNPKITETKKEINKDIPFKSRKQIKEEFKEKCKNGMRVIIDCDFEHLMDERCIKSMVRQIVDLYSINKYSTNPFRVILYGVGKQIKEGLEKSDYKNWIGIEIYFKEDYPNFDKFIEDILYKDDKRPMKDIKYNIYYLSADSENNIENIDKNSTYIIGGIVDRNKYKGLSLNKAKELGINHGKFPIGEYLKLQSSQVLTTNHTFHILNEFSIRHDWKEAFVSIIPKRKQEENEELEEDKKSDKK